MIYSIKANSLSGNDGLINIKETVIEFGTTKESSSLLANPAELFLSSLAACILKNVERFSDLLKFEYTQAEIVVNSTRFEKPPRMDKIEYNLRIYSHDDSLNINLLQKNIEEYGTIFNTIKSSCDIIGKVERISTL